MDNKKKISIYVRNKDITPSSYYRIIQYAKDFEGNVCIRNIAPKKLYLKYSFMDKTNKVYDLFVGIFYYLVMLLRVTYFMLVDLVNKPNFIIVSKALCPRYTPRFLIFFVRKLSKYSMIYWDFDDNIFNNKQISNSQALALEKYSEKIIVTSQFLKSKINSKYHNKVILLPTTDGDLQGFEEIKLREKRKVSFDYEIRLIWVATSFNIPHLNKVINDLDLAASRLKSKYNKELILTIVCDRDYTCKVNYLIIRNIKWTRKIAMEEIYNSHIGIMPLINNEYSLGKGGFKLVQYISTGLPVIASKVGFNNEVVDKRTGILIDDKENCNLWIDAIEKMASSMETWEEYSINAYVRWKDKFSYSNNLKIWNELLS